MNTQPLRADAARNAGRIVTAARLAYAELGPGVPAEEIARRAGVGIRTLYRRFPTRADLARAAVEESIAEYITPVLDAALAAPAADQGLVRVIEAAVTLAARDYNALSAARTGGSLTPDVYTPFYDSLALLMRRAQDQGALRADLHPDDLPRILVMLVSVLMTLDPRGGGWKRYVDLMMDGLRAPGATPLDTPVPAMEMPPEDGWPIPSGTV